MYNYWYRHNTSLHEKTMLQLNTMKNYEREREKDGEWCELQFSPSNRKHLLMLAYHPPLKLSPCNEIKTLWAQWDF